MSSSSSLTVPILSDAGSAGSGINLSYLDALKGSDNGVIEFLSENHCSNTARKVTIVVGAGLAGGTAGAALGLGLCALCCEMPAPVVVPAMAGVGFVSGVVVTASMVTWSDYAVYTDWRTAKFENSAFKFFAGLAPYLPPKLRDSTFECCISRETTRRPVQTFFSNYVYDYDNLMKHIERYGTDPAATGIRISRRDTYAHPQMMGTLNEMLKRVEKGEVQGLQLTDDDQAKTKSYRQQLEARVKKDYNESCTRLLTLQKEGKITPQEYAERLGVITSYAYPKWE